MAELIPVLNQSIEIALEAYVAQSTELDSIDVETPAYKRILNIMNGLESDIRLLSRMRENANTARFIHGNEKLVKVNEELAQVLENLTTMAQKLKALAAVVTAVTAFLGGVIEPLLGPPAI